jgi:hypothetical protein
MIRHVRLELARCRDFPEGSAERGYDLALPLTETGYLDHEEWLNNRGRAGFRRYWIGDDDRGWLRYDRGGWKLVFETGPDSDEVIFQGEGHRFAEGEYITLMERDGEMHTFRVADVG